MGRRNLATSVLVVLAILLGSGSASGQPPAGQTGYGQQPPLNVTPPSIGGSAQVGSTSTADPGTWSGSGVKYAYQWLRCDSGGASCNPIGGAGGPSDTLLPADTGATLRVMVTGSNQNGSAAATSAATAVVAGAPAPTPTTTTTTPTTTPTTPSPPTYSPSRSVFCFGDPNWVYGGQNATTPGWWFGGT